MSLEKARNMEIPTDIQALLIISDLTRVREWKETFTKVFEKIGNLYVLGQVHATRFDDSQDIEVVFVACGGKESKETFYPSLRATYKNALIIAISSRVLDAKEV